MERIRLLEILLAEMIVYFLLWLWNDYIATLLSLAFGGIFTAVLLISLLVEWIERSKVPIWYYKFMLVSIVAPALVALIYLYFSGGVEWME